MQKNLLPQHWRLLFYHMRYGFKPLCIGDLTPISFPSKTHVKNIILPTSWTFSIKWQQFFKLVIMVKQLKFQIRFWFWFWFSNSCNIFQFMDFKRGTLLLWNWCAGTKLHWLNRPKSLHQKNIYIGCSSYTKSDWDFTQSRDKSKFVDTITVWNVK